MDGELRTHEISQYILTHFKFQFHNIWYVKWMHILQNTDGCAKSTLLSKLSLIACFPLLFHLSNIRISIVLIWSIFSKGQKFTMHTRKKKNKNSHWMKVKLTLWKKKKTTTNHIRVKNSTAHCIMYARCTHTHSSTHIEYNATVSVSVDTIFDGNICAWDHQLAVEQMKREYLRKIKMKSKSRWMRLCSGA